MFFIFISDFFIYDFLFCLVGVRREQEKKVYYFNVFLIKLVKILDFIDSLKFDNDIKINLSL